MILKKQIKIKKDLSVLFYGRVLIKQPFLKYFYRNRWFYLKRDGNLSCDKKEIRYLADCERIKKELEKAIEIWETTQS